MSADAAPDVAVEVQAEVDVPEVPLGESCANPFVVLPGDLLFTTVADTSSATDDHDASSCGSPDGAGVPDLVYSFTPATTAAYSFIKQGDLSGPSIYYVLTGCGTAAEACFAGPEDVGGGGVVFGLLEAGITYYLVVDGAAPEDVGSFEPIITEPCTPACDGLACGDDGCGGSCGSCDPG